MTGSSRVTIGLLHPGEMGSAVGGALVRAGHEVVWVSEGRSAATRDRAAAEGLTDVGEIGTLVTTSRVVLSICPPHAAADVARSVAGFVGVYVDANAIAPSTAAEVASIAQDHGAHYVDGGIVGPPPRARGDTRLFLSGDGAAGVAALFDATVVEAVPLAGAPMAASAVKMTYAAWTKGTAALILAIAATARELGVEDDLIEEWRRSQPHLEQRARQAADSAASKGWRWVAEMEEIAATFEAAGLPRGFHAAAAEIFRGGKGAGGPSGPDRATEG